MLKKAMLGTYASTQYFWFYISAYCLLGFMMVWCAPMESGTSVGGCNEGMVDNESSKSKRMGRFLVTITKAEAIPDTPKSSCNEGIPWVEDHLFRHSVELKADGDRSELRSLDQLVDEEDDWPWAEPYHPRLWNCIPEGWEEDLELTPDADSEDEKHSALIPPLNSANYGKKLLVLDLDDTLIKSYGAEMPNPFSASYSTVTGNISPTIQWKVRFDCLFQQWDVLVRPFLLEFIDSVSPLYEVAIWTAGTKSYADPIIDLIDPSRTRIQHRLFREACDMNEAADGSRFLVKDLRRLGRDMRSIVVVDNTPSTYFLNQANAVPIETWIGEPKDRQLVHLSKYLLTDMLELSDVTSRRHDISIWDPVFLTRVKESRPDGDGELLSPKSNNNNNNNNSTASRPDGDGELLSPKSNNNNNNNNSTALFDDDYGVMNSENCTVLKK